MLTMNNQEHNGWYNWETWCVNLWMDNTQQSHEGWRQIARESIEAEESGHEGTNWFYFEDQLKQYLDYIQEDVDNHITNGMVKDLLGAAVSEVNTREIAMHWVADELENIEVTG